MQVKYRNFAFYRWGFFSLKFVWIVFVSLSDDFITQNRWITHNTCKIFFIFTTVCTKIPNIIFFVYVTFIVTLLLIWVTFFLSDLLILLHDICFGKVCDWFISVIKMNMLKFAFSVLFGTHTLLDKSLRVLQQPTYLSKLTANTAFIWMYINESRLNHTFLIA